MATQNISQGIVVTAQGAIIQSPVVQTIANLRLVSGVVDGQAVLLDGYAAEGDGGGGQFFWNASSTASDDGGCIIAPTGVSTGRWYRVFDGRTFNVKWYGATGNGTTDDTTSIKNTLAAGSAAGSAMVYCPAGTYVVSSTITLPPQVSFTGAGSTGSNLDSQNVEALGVTCFKWTGSSGGTVFLQTGIQGGLLYANFAIDCNNTAEIGISIDRLRYSTITNIFIGGNLGSANTSAAFMMKVNSSTANDNCQFNDIGPLYLYGPTCLLLLDSFNGSLNNVCHNTFRRLYVNCKGGSVNTGIIINQADNNNFLGTYTAVFNYPTDYGLQFTSSAARANYFWELEGTVNAMSGSKNAIFGFDTENAEPEPTVASGAQLFWTEVGNNAIAWNMTLPLRSLGGYLVGNIATTGAGVDPSRFNLLRNSSNSIMYLGFDSSNVLNLYVSDTGEGVTGPPIKIGNNRLGFFGSSAIAQPSVTGTTTGFTAGTGSTVLVASTFTGNTGSTAYTIGDIVNNLKTLGILKT